MLRNWLTTGDIWWLADQLEAVLEGAEPECAAMVTLAAAPENFENPGIASGIRNEETVIAAFGRPDLATIDEPRRVDDDRSLLRWLSGLTRVETSATRGARHVPVARGNTLRNDWLRRVSS
jgi:hypothetical protein